MCIPKESQPAAPKRQTTVVVRRRQETHSTGEREIELAGRINAFGEAAAEQRREVFRTKSVVVLCALSPLALLFR